MPGGSKKHGRNEKKCKRYKDNATRTINKRRKLIPHVDWQPNDGVAADALKKLT